VKEKEKLMFDKYYVETRDEHDDLIEYKEVNATAFGVILSLWNANCSFGVPCEITFGNEGVATRRITLGRVAASLDGYAKVYDVIYDYMDSL